MPISNFPSYPIYKIKHKIYIYIFIYPNGRIESLFVPLSSVTVCVCVKRERERDEEKKGAIAELRNPNFEPGSGRKGWRGKHRQRRERVFRVLSADLPQPTPQGPNLHRVRFRSLGFLFFSFIFDF